jgi:hypothetical protein
MKNTLKLALLTLALLAVHRLHAETNCVIQCWLTPNQWPGVIIEYMNQTEQCEPDVIAAPGGSRYSGICIPGTTTNACAGWQPGVIWSVRTVGNVPLVSPYYAGLIQIWCANGHTQDQWCIVPAGMTGADFKFLRYCDGGSSCTVFVCPQYFTPE